MGTTQWQNRTEWERKGTGQTCLRGIKYEFWLKQCLLLIHHTRNWTICKWVLLKWNSSVTMEGLNTTANCGCHWMSMECLFLPWNQDSVALCQYIVFGHHQISARQTHTHSTYEYWGRMKQSWCKLSFIFTKAAESVKHKPLKLVHNWPRLHTVLVIYSSTSMRIFKLPWILFFWKFKREIFVVDWGMIKSASSKLIFLILLTVIKYLRNLCKCW